MSSTKEKILIKLQILLTCSNFVHLERILIFSDHFFLPPLFVSFRGFFSSLTLKEKMIKTTLVDDRVWKNLRTHHRYWPLLATHMHNG